MMIHWRSICDRTAITIHRHQWRRMQRRPNDDQLVISRRSNGNPLWLMDRGKLIDRHWTHQHSRHNWWHSRHSPRSPTSPPTICPRTLDKVSADRVYRQTLQIRYSCDPCDRAINAPLSSMNRKWLIYRWLFNASPLVILDRHCHRWITFVANGAILAKAFIGDSDYCPFNSDHYWWWVVQFCH